MIGTHSNGDFGNNGLNAYLMGADDHATTDQLPGNLASQVNAPANPLISKEIWYFLAAVAALLILKKVLKK